MTVAAVEDRRASRTRAVVLLYGGLVPAMCLVVVLALWGATAPPQPPDGQSLAVGIAVVLSLVPIGFAVVSVWRLARAGLLVDRAGLTIRNPRATVRRSWC